MISLYLIVATLFIWAVKFALWKIISNFVYSLIDIT